MLSAPQVRSLPLLLAVLLLPACATVRPDVNAQMAGVSPVSEDWQASLPAGVSQNADASVSESHSLAGWWQQLNDPLLNQLVTLTLVNNPDMATAALNHRLALLQLGIAGTDNIPDVRASVSGGRSGTSDSMSNSASAGLSASWEVDLWGTMSSEEKSARAGVDQAVAELRDAQVSLIAQTASAYTSLRLAQQNIRVATASIGLRQESYDLARASWQAGLGTELDVMQAKTLLEQSRANLPQYQQARSEAINQLRVLAGGELNSLLPSLQADAELPALPQQLALSLPAETLRQRPDVKANEYALIAQGEAVVQAHNQRFPTFTLTGNLSSSGTNMADVFSADSLVRSIAASISYSLFDSGVLKTNERTQQLKFEQALQTYRTSLLTAQQEVEDALSTLDAAQQQQTSYQQAEASAQLAEELARMQYDAGMLDFNDLLDAQSDLLSARNNRVQNDGALLSDWIQLYRVAGGGWQALADANNAPDAAHNKTDKKTQNHTQETAGGQKQI
ncbi:efflux transporter outer membrane subunit [Thalassolituus sp. LLYu03]|uniref:efflux transporter outer membrane subunit n=1 Tax=Thalassolituus sp. LLYu03 TaxID=3421656 RepID=UPI003D289F85